MYIASLTKHSKNSASMQKNTPKCTDIQLDQLIKNGFIKNDRKTLTDLGRSSIKVVLVGGVFNIIHPGHIYTLNSAKLLGDILVVVVATDAMSLQMKKKIPLHNQEQRKILVNSLKMVDVCLIGNKKNIFTTVRLVKPKIIALGYDQIHQEKSILEGCKKLNLDIKVVRLQSPIPEISSSNIEKEYNEKIYGI